MILTLLLQGLIGPPVQGYRGPCCMEYATGGGSKILVKVDSDGEFVGPSANKMGFVLLTLAHQPRNMPITTLIRAGSPREKRQGFVAYFGKMKTFMLCLI